LFEIKTHERIVPYKCNNVMLLSGQITPRHGNSYTTRLFLKVSASAIVIHKQVEVQEPAEVYKIVHALHNKKTLILYHEVMPAGVPNFCG
jgi:hypothetical protein